MEMQGQSNPVRPSGPFVAVNGSQRRRPARGRKILAVLAVFLLLTAAAAAGYAFKDRQSKADLAAAGAKASGLENQLNELRSKLDEKSKPEETAPAVAFSKPAVAYVPEGLFTATEKAELQRKLIDPMTDFYEGKVVAIIIEVYNSQKFVNGGADDKYIVDSIGKDGVVAGFLYGSKKNGIDWWAPTCMDACDFTAEFKAKYPEVVKKSQ